MGMAPSSKEDQDCSVFCPVTAHHDSVVMRFPPMEDKREPTQSHEDRKAHALMKRIEKTQASEEAATEQDTNRMLDDYDKEVGS